MTIFEELPEPIRRALHALQFTKPTDIQREAIPAAIVGTDIMGIAQTGTGKTAAFVIPIIERLLMEPGKGIRALILCPTRELAMQVDENITSLAKFTNLQHLAIFGGVGQGPQVKKLQRGVDILVATPGRLFDLHEQKHVSLGRVEFLVLDEADRMLDMGFIHDIRRICQLIPKKRQTLFFSATMAKEVTQLASSLLRKPVRIEITPHSTPVEKIDQKVLFVDNKDKVELLLHLLSKQHLERVLIFSRTKYGADKLCRILKKNKVSAQQIHGDRTQSQRTKALKAFADGKARCLVATDVAARGIDIDNISHVINYDLPREAENYVHRIGRTARAGAEGTAYSFCTADEKTLLNAIHKTIGASLPLLDHPFHSEAAKVSKRAPPNTRRARKGFRNKKNPRSFGAQKKGRSKDKFRGSKFKKSGSQTSKKTFKPKR